MCLLACSPSGAHRPAGPSRLEDAGYLRGQGTGLDAKPVGPPCPRLHVAQGGAGLALPVGTPGRLGHREGSEDRWDLPCPLPMLTSGQRHQDSEQEFRAGTPPPVTWGHQGALAQGGLGHCSRGRESRTGSRPRSECPTESLPQGRVGSESLGVGSREGRTPPAEHGGPGGRGHYLGTGWRPWRPCVPETCRGT